MAKAGSTLRFGAAKTRSTKAKANAKAAKMGSGMAVRDSAKAAAHAAAGLAHTVREEAVEMTERAGELTERAGEATRRTGEQAMLRVGEWVMAPPIAEKLGIKAQKRRVGMLGMLLGALLLSETYPWYADAVRSVNLGNLTWPQVTGLSPWVLLGGLGVVAVVLFIVIERWERRSALASGAAAEPAPQVRGEPVEAA